MRRTRGVVAGLAVAALLGTAGPAAAAPSTPPPEGSSDEWLQQVGPAYLDSNEALSDYTTWLGRTDAFADQGYLALVADVEHRGARLLWKGPSPLLAVAALEATRRGLAFSLEERPYSPAELATFRRRLAAGEDRLRRAGFEPDGLEGITAEARPLTLLGRRVARAGAEPSLDDVAALASRLAGVPVRVREVEPAVPAVG